MQEPVEDHGGAGDGYQLTNLDDYDAEYSEARRMTNGEVLLTNFKREYEVYLQEREGEDVDGT